MRAQSLHVDHAAPLPLGHHRAITRGAELRALGSCWSYSVISDVMREYHGWDRSAKWWGAHLRAAGAKPYPRGVPFDGSEKKAA